MDQTTIGPTTATATGGSRVQQATAASAGAKIDTDFNTFLSLLTAQLRNQDPLKPVDSTEFIAQLAQFSSVEQQVRGNKTLETIAATIAGGEAADLANWLGTEVRAPAILAFDGKPVSLTFPAEATATRSALVVKTSAGQEVGRLPLSPTDTEVTFTGADGKGGTVPAGNYLFTVERFAEKEPLPEATAAGFAGVREARLTDGEVRLVLDGGSTVSLSEVLAVRMPQ